MFFSRAAFAALLLVAEIQVATTTAIIYTSNGLQGRRALFDDVAIDHLVPREALPQSTATNSGTGSAGANTTAACISAISTLSAPSNPAGILACYDISYLNISSGVFTADLRLYQAAQPSGIFAGVQVTNIIASMQYPSAAISSINKKVRRQSAATSASELQSTSLIGQLDKALRLNHLNSTSLMSLLIPSITLEAASPNTGQAVTTRLSPRTDIAYFPTGVFAGTSPQVVVAAGTQTAVTAAQSLAAGFILPGTTFGIFPTGLIVTGSWSVLFLSAFGYGTVRRIGHRKQFRQRVANPRFGSP